MLVQVEGTSWEEMKSFLTSWFPLVWEGEGRSNDDGSNQDARALSFKFRDITTLMGGLEAKYSSNYEAGLQDQDADG